ncbi:MAG: GGDEF domain-containing protein [Lachnospiraceae bacterium]|nr:GGDEF domain-containing protein [Lachnospiraceae bacterium]
MGNRLKRFISSDIEKDVQAFVDRKSLSNIARTAPVILFFEAVALCIFLLTREEFNHAAGVSIASASICLFLCALGTACSHMMLRKELLCHGVVEGFNLCYYLMLSLWSVSVGYRNYGNNEQLLTFFAVQIMMVCFVLLRPVLCVICATVVYVALYLSTYRYDGGKGLNIFNYVLLLLITITGMIVRFRSEVETAEKSTELKRTNDMLFYNIRHDGLTSLRNRKALEEDVPKVTDKNVTVYMIDVNYFKEVNDRYGHAVGDSVLRETAKWIKSVFNAERCYRYGGDEFLVLSTDGDVYKEETYTFPIPEVPDDMVLLSIGRAAGVPHDHDELFKLISAADAKLYSVKRRTHSETENR